LVDGEAGRGEDGQAGNSRGEDEQALAGEGRAGNSAMIRGMKKACPIYGRPVRKR
jgi:hypothetical protein